MRGVWASSVESSAASGKSRGLFGGTRGSRDASLGADGSGAPAAGASSIDLAAGRSVISWLLALAVAVAAILALAPSAMAERGVKGTLDSRGDVGPAINPNGAGGGSAGDIYVSLDRFSASGDLLHRWGRDSVASGPGNADEMQQVMIRATAGTFTLGFGGEATAPIDFDASAADLKTALEALDTVDDGALDVTGGPGDAAGSSPYLVTFGGAMGGTNQSRIEVDDSSLGGGPAEGWSATVVEGDTGFEVCDPAGGDVCKPPTNFILDSSTYLNGHVRFLGSLAVDRATGDYYAAGDRRVNRYAATGEFLRSFGFDVVASGPHDSDVDAKRLLRVSATAGTYTLTYGSLCCDPVTTDPIPYNAAAAVVEEELNETLNENDPSIGFGGEVGVSGGPGGSGGATPYTIAFGGKLAGDTLEPFSVNGGNLNGSATMATLALGGGPEVCVHPVDVCKQGEDDLPAGLSNNAGVSVAPPGAPNAGNVLLVETDVSRVSEYTADGEFVRMFGGGVVDGGAEGTASTTAGSHVLTSVATTSKAFLVGQELSGAGIPAGATIAVLGPGTITISEPATATASGVAISAPAGATNVPNNELRGISLDSGVSGGNFKLTFATPNPSNSSATTPNIPYNATVAQVQTALESLANIGGAANVEVTLDPGGNPGGGASPGGPWTAEFKGKFADADMVDNFFLDALTTDSGSPDLVGGIARIRTVQNGGGGYEVCTAASGDFCRNGVAGDGLGQFNFPSAVAVDGDGNVYTVETFSVNGGNHRVQKFVPPSPYDEAVLTPEEFGTSETQELMVNAGSGQFRLSYGNDDDGTTGTGDLVDGSRTITDVNTSTGEFRPGYRLFSNGLGGAAFFENTYITAVGPDTLTISKPAQNTKPNEPLESSFPYVTGDIAHNAPASGPGSVEEALNALPSISAGGGSVTVTGGPGDAGGTSPYTIVFDGGPLERSDPDELRLVEGATPLSGGSGSGADQASVTTTVAGGPSGVSSADTPNGIAIGADDSVFVSRRYRPGASDCPYGLPSFEEVRVQELTSSGDVTETSLPCQGTLGDHSISARLPAIINVSDSEDHVDVDPLTGLAYLTERTSVDGDSRTYVFGDQGPDPVIALDPPSELSANGATISGTIDPNGPIPGAYPNPIETTFRVEFKKSSDPPSAWTPFALDLTVGTGDDPIPFSQGLNGLEPNTPYDARVVATKPFGFAPQIGPVQTFTTLTAPPRIEGVFSSEVTVSSANLHALIDPLGLETTYHFEYGPTTSYGNSTPETSVGDGLGFVAVQDLIENLDPVVQHFRVVATNAAGSTASTNQTFNFYPETCPNAAARQQTGAGLLPDCRAYELVSPGSVGTVRLNAGGPTSAHATNPSRFAYEGSYGVIPGPWNPPNTLGGDTYAATRTSSGWETHFVGIEVDLDGNPSTSPPGVDGSSEHGAPSRSDRSLDRLMEWGPDADRTSSQFGEEATSSAPYVFDAENDFLGRLPTNVSQIPEGDLVPSAGGFVGEQRLSPDGSRFVYSSADVSLAPGGLESGAGSVYVNDIATGTVEVASKTAAGGNIPPAAGGFNTGHFLRVPAVSTDGSHVLIAAPADCEAGDDRDDPCPLEPSVLYLRDVSDDTSYDVSRGVAVDYEGMSADGSTVLFTTDEQMTGDDTDTSVDLYRWSEDGDTLTRVSAGGGAAAGNTDGCVPEDGWTSQCDVVVISKSGAGDETRTDNPVAANGDVYFYSPEQLVGTNGIPGRRNLYVGRGDGLNYVATLDFDKPASRIQVTADGRFGAFITTTQLTSYDNAGFAEMYRFNADTDNLRCVSCLPDGSPPSHDVEGSENGIFMTDDGRAFFSTIDELVPRDSDGLPDVYEYVDGRPQLISTGSAARLGSLLVGVSADGVDAYIATTETLVPEDENGPFLKFYDARTNGGIPRRAPIQPCAAADECHQADSTPIQAPRLGSGADLAAGGNVRVSRCALIGRNARKHSRRARALRTRARRVARRATSSRARRGVVGMRRNARRLARRARRASTRAKRCRTVQRARANRRAAR